MDLWNFQWVWTAGGTHPFQKPWPTKRCHASSILQTHEKGRFMALEHTTEAACTDEPLTLLERTERITDHFLAPQTRCFCQLNSSARRSLGARQEKQGRGRARKGKERGRVRLRVAGAGVRVR